MTSSAKLVADQDAHMNEIVQLYHHCMRAHSTTSEEMARYPRLAIVLANAIGRDCQGDVPAGNLGGIVITCVKSACEAQGMLEEESVWSKLLVHWC